MAAHAHYSVYQSVSLDDYIYGFSICYVTGVFWTSTVSSSVLLRHYSIAFYSWFPLFHYLFVTSVLCLGFDCLFFFCLLCDYAFSQWFPLFHYQFVTSLCYLFKVPIVSLSVCYDCIFLCM